MNHSILTALLLCSNIVAFGADADLVGQSNIEADPASTVKTRNMKAASTGERSTADTDAGQRSASETFELQLRQSCPFDPNCLEFFPQAVKGLGAFRGTLAFFDRLTRSTTIGSVSYPASMRGRDGRIHHGVEEYEVGEGFHGKALLCPRASVASGLSGVTGPSVKPAFGEARYISSDIAFVDYLFASSRYDDAGIYLTCQNFFPSDTLSFLRGLSRYSLRDFFSAAFELSLVPEASPYYGKSTFLRGFSLACMGDYSSAIDVVQGYDGGNEGLRGLYLASLYLIENDLNSFNDFSTDMTSFSREKEQLQDIYNSRLSRSRKSPWIAAGASAIVPGLGKVYAGRLDEGISNFLCVGTLAGFTAECYIKKGARDWRTILFGSLASLFYLGNIYGSYVSVGIYNSTLFDAQNTSILFNLHLPISNLVGR